jgi:hypothetical protein
VLPPSEVERAAALLRTIGLNRQIKRVETAEDKIVYAGVTHDAFVCLKILTCYRGFDEGSRLTKLLDVLSKR